jgi:hypothetical protein
MRKLFWDHNAPSGPTVTSTPTVLSGHGYLTIVGSAADTIPTAKSGESNIKIAEKSAIHLLMTIIATLHLVVMLSVDALGSRNQQAAFG